RDASSHEVHNILFPIGFGVLFRFITLAAMDRSARSTKTTLLLSTKVYSCKMLTGRFPTSMLRKLLLSSLLTVSGVMAAAIVSPYDSSYTMFNLGSAPGVPVSYGGLVFKAGDPNTLLLGGAANFAGGIYAVGVTRDAQGHVTGFDGTSSLFSTAPGIDGGL